MPKKKAVFDKDKAFQSIIGISQEEPQEQEKEETISNLEKTNKDVKKNKKEVKEEQSKHIQEPKKRGRKKLENKEKKKQYSFTIYPSVYEKAQTTAEEDGKTLSEIISEFLVKYGKY